MNFPDQDAFFNECLPGIKEIFQMLSQLPSVPISRFDPKHTAVVLIDLIGGFVRQGALFSPRLASVVPKAAKLLSAANRLEIPVIAFADSHNPKSPEFSAFPPHCLAGTPESEIAPELHQAGEFLLIPKNSTNGCITRNFQDFKMHHPEINQYIVAGVCTDLCVMQFALTLLAQFRQENHNGKVIIPVDLVETYDAGASHPAALMNAAALKLMANFGVTLFQSIGCETEDSL